MTHRRTASRRRRVVFCVLGLVAATTQAHATTTAAILPSPTLCGAAEAALPGSAYYAIELVNTGRVAGARQAKGTVTVAFARSPFGLSLASAGEYVTRLDIRLRALPLSPKTVYAVWVTTPQLDRVQLLGLVGEDLRVSGSVAWNKYLVVVTREASADSIGARWAGPVVLRGMSRSGRMHTMAGHGAFQAEPCAKYGY